VKGPKKEHVNEAWRVSPFPDLSGKGGYLADGRWHNRGRPVSYLSPSAPGALIETLVHLDLDPEGNPPESYQLLRVEFAREVLVEELEGGDYPEDWIDNLPATREIGDEWLERGDSLLLKVPSRVMPDASNYLFNPQHPDANAASVEAITRDYDPRIFKIR
tara:strand:+ start:719 stop:1201 length:483 start_codon:yes stop_codon:yes gene_type:complete